MIEVEKTKEKIKQRLKVKNPNLTNKHKNSEEKTKSELNGKTEHTPFLQDKNFKAAWTRWYILLWPKINKLCNRICKIVPFISFAMAVWLCQVE